VIIDIGAGIGEFTIHALSENMECRVFGIEPFNESFAFLEKNLELNSMENILPLQAAVRSKPGKVEVDTFSGDPLQNRIIDRSNNSSVNSVPAITLMSILEDHHIERCGLLKMDCEGGEFDILLSLSPSDLSRFDNIVLEYHDSLTTHTHEEIVKLLYSCSFKVDIEKNQIHSNLGYIYAKYQRF